MNTIEYDYEARLLALYAVADLRGDTAAGWLFDTEYKQAEFEAYRARQSMDRLKRAILECDTPAAPEIKVMFMSEFPRRVFYASYEAVDEVDNHTRNNPCQWCHDIARSEQ